MKAAVCTKYGPPEVLKIMEVPKPLPKANEVLIKIITTSVTVADCRVRGFNVPVSFWIPARLALGLTRPRKSILGMEIAGLVEAVGETVTKFKVGDEVLATTGHDRFGGNAEYTCLPESGMIVSKPANISFEQATSIPFGGLSSLCFLRKANIQKAQKVLIYGASGSLGTYAVQLAKHFGAHVTGVCSSTNLEMVASIGADKVIDYTKEDFTAVGEEYDVIFDAVGKAPLAKSISTLKKSGIFLHAVGTPAVMLKMNYISLMTGKKLVGGDVVSKVEDLAFLTALVQGGTVSPVIDRVYPFDQIVEAHRYVDLGHKKGSVVIKIGR
jgi:NADPH:quinone reductase-like Zn-dependent oxidoreductase